MPERAFIFELLTGARYSSFASQHQSLTAIFCHYILKVLIFCFLTQALRSFFTSLLL